MTPAVLDVRGEDGFVKAAISHVEAGCEILAGKIASDSIANVSPILSPELGNDEIFVRAISAPELAIDLLAETPENTRSGAS